MPTKTPHIDDIPNAVFAWLKTKKLSFEAKLYTPEAWRARAEKYGSDSLFTITSEGPLNRLINYPDSKADVKLINSFEKYLEKLGIYYELGYAWSFHFYRVSK